MSEIGFGKQEGERMLVKIVPKEDLGAVREELYVHFIYQSGGLEDDSLHLFHKVENGDHGCGTRTRI